MVNKGATRGNKPSKIKIIANQCNIWPSHDILETNKGGAKALEDLWFSA